MKKILLKGKGFVLKNSQKLITGTAKALPAVASGIYEFSKDITSDSYYSIRGKKIKKKLITKINKQNIEFDIKKKKFRNDYPFLDASILSGLTAYEMSSSGIPSDVSKAYELAFPNLAREANFIDSWNSFDDYESRLGFLNAMKGKLFEVKYLDHLNNNLEAGYKAELAEVPTQAGWDIKVSGPDDEISELLQLKASTSLDYVKTAIETYPEIDVITLSDLEGQLSSINNVDRITASSISNQGLEQNISSATNNDLGILSLAPLISIAYIVFSGYREKDISEFKKQQKIVKRFSNLSLNSAIIGITGPIIGISLVLGREFLFRNARKDKEAIKYLKNQIKKNKKTQKFWEKRVSRRTFLKGLVAASSMMILKPKNYG